MESVHALLGIEANTFSRRTPPINPRHARNTRLRKKAYIERLKQSVSELSAHREKVQEKEWLRARQAEREQNDFFATLHQLFDLRMKRECDPAKWREVITDDFVMTLPITPYRSFDPAQVCCISWPLTCMLGSKAFTRKTPGAFNARRQVARESSDVGDSGALRVIRGVDGMIADACSFFVMLQAVARYPNAHGSPLVRASYHHSPEDMVISNNLVMCRWLLMTENAVACGAASEVSCARSGSVPGLVCLRGTPSSDFLVALVCGHLSPCGLGFAAL